MLRNQLKRLFMLKEKKDNNNHRYKSKRRLFMLIE